MQSALLAWIYLKDRKCQYILEREQDVLPEDIQITSDKSLDSVPQNTSHLHLTQVINSITQSIQSTVDVLNKTMNAETMANREMNSLKMA